MKTSDFRLATLAVTMCLSCIVYQTFHQKVHFSTHMCGPSGRQSALWYSKLISRHLVCQTICWCKHYKQTLCWTVLPMIILIQSNTVQFVGLKNWEARLHYVYFAKKCLLVIQQSCENENVRKNSSIWYTWSRTCCLQLSSGIHPGDDDIIGHALPSDTSWVNLWIIFCFFNFSSL